MIDWASLARWASGGVGVGGSLAGGFLFFRWLLESVFGRMDRQQSRLDRTTQAMFDRLEQEVRRLTERVAKTEADLAECKVKHAESEARVMQLEAVLQGYGDAREHAALIVAAEKLEGKA